MYKKFLFGILLASVLGVAIASTVSPILVGGDRDSHGCIPSAGYIWSESSQKCVRPWEENTASTTDSSRVGCFMFLNNIRFGQRGDDVKLLQQNLFDKGYLKANPTGYFGSATFKAVQKYQKENGISSTGFVGEKTRGILRNHFCNTVPVDDNQYVEAPKDCKVWFDGCNNCFRGEPGSPMACTKMACLTSKLVPSCKEYFSTSTASTTLIKDCPTEKITDMMPVMCIKAPCPAQPRDSYYIYKGVRYEIDKFDADYVKNNCTVKETKVY